MKTERATTAGREETRKRVQQLKDYEASHPEKRHYSLKDLEKRMLCEEVKNLALKKMQRSIKAGDDAGMREGKRTNEMMVAEIRSIDAKYV